MLDHMRPVKFAPYHNLLLSIMTSKEDGPIGVTEGQILSNGLYTVSMNAKVVDSNSPPTCVTPVGHSLSMHPLLLF